MIHTNPKSCLTCNQCQATLYHFLLSQNYSIWFTLSYLTYTVLCFFILFFGNNSEFRVNHSVENHSLLCGLLPIFHCVGKGIGKASYNSPSCPVNRMWGQKSWGDGGALFLTNSHLKRRFVVSFHPQCQAVFD